MRTRRLADLALLVGGVAVLFLLGAERQTLRAAEPPEPVSWQGLVGDGPRPGVAPGQRMIVVLKWPSLAERVAAAGGVATDRQERRWTRSEIGRASGRERG